MKVALAKAPENERLVFPEMGVKGVAETPTFHDRTALCESRRLPLARQLFGSCRDRSWQARRVLRLDGDHRMNGVEGVLEGLDQPLARKNMSAGFRESQ